MKKNYFSVPQLSKVQQAIAKDLGFTGTGTIETMAKMAKGNPAIHWLVAKWFVDLLNRGEWGTAWDEVFRDIVQDLGYDRPETAGTNSLASMFLTYMIDDQDEMMSELLSTVADVLNNASGLHTAPTQPKQETQGVDSVDFGKLMFPEQPKPPVMLDPVYVQKAKQLLTELRRELRRAGYTGDSTNVWFGDNAPTVADHSVIFANRLIFEGVGSDQDIDNWWYFSHQLMSYISSAISDGSNYESDRRALALAVIVFALDLGTTNDIAADTSRILSWPGLSTGLLDHWNNQILGNNGYLVDLLNVMCRGVLSVLATDRQHKQAQATVAKDQKQSITPHDAAVEAKQKADSEVSTAKANTKAALERVVEAGNAKLSTNVTLVNQFFRDARSHSRRCWLPTDFVSIFDISRANIHSSKSKQKLTDSVVALNTFVRTLQEELTKAGLDGSSFFTAYWLLQVATRSHYYQTIRSYNKFVPTKTSPADRKNQLNRLETLARDPKAHVVFWETAAKFLN